MARPLGGRHGIVTLLALAALASGGCALSSEVLVEPLFLVPGDTWRPGTEIEPFFVAGDWLRVIEVAEWLSQRRKLTEIERLRSAQARLIARRYDDAERALRDVLESAARPPIRAEAAWGLSQVAYMRNDFVGARRWADAAVRNGLQILSWHLEFLEAVGPRPLYVIQGTTSGHVPLQSGEPRIPRLDVRLNDGPKRTAVIDSGAVLTIVSETVASETGIEMLEGSRGTFFGITGNPIAVRFGLLRKLTIGDLTVENVPVAIMRDEKLDFVIGDETPFRTEILLGATLLKEFRITIDYPAHRVLFEVADRTATSQAPQNLFIVDFRPVVHGTINRNGWHPFLLDTGSEVTWLNAGRYDVSKLERLPNFHSAHLQGIGGGMRRGAKLQNVEVGLDRWTGRFRSLPLYESDPRLAGIIGQNLLEHFVVVIDFGAMRVDATR